MADRDASMDVGMLVHEQVEDVDDAQGRSGPDVEIIEVSANTAKHDDGPGLTTMQFDQPIITTQEDSVFHFSALGELLHEEVVKKNGLAVIVPPAQNRWEYKVFQEYDEVDEILEEYDDAGFIEYLVLFLDGSEDVVSLPFRLVFVSTHPTSPTLPPPSSPILMLDCFHITTSLFIFRPCPWTTSSTYYLMHLSGAPVYIQRTFPHTFLQSFLPCTPQNIFVHISSHRQIQCFLHWKHISRVTLLIYYSAAFTDLI